jgi:hypothetical protein
MDKSTPLGERIRLGQLVPDPLATDFITHHSRKKQTNRPVKPIHIAELFIFLCHKLACQGASWLIANRELLC